MILLLIPVILMFRSQSYPPCPVSHSCGYTGLDKQNFTVTRLGHLPEEGTGQLTVKSTY